MKYSAVFLFVALCITLFNTSATVKLSRQPAESRLEKPEKPLRTKLAENAELVASKAIETADAACEQIKQLARTAKAFKRAARKIEDTAMNAAEKAKEATKKAVLEVIEMVKKAAQKIKEKVQRKEKPEKVPNQKTLPKAPEKQKPEKAPPKKEPEKPPMEKKLEEAPKRKELPQFREKKELPPASLPKGKEEKRRRDAAAKPAGKLPSLFLTKPAVQAPHAAKQYPTLVSVEKTEKRAEEQRDATMAKEKGFMDAQEIKGLAKLMEVKHHAMTSKDPAESQSEALDRALKKNDHLLRESDEKAIQEERAEIAAGRYFPPPDSVPDPMASDEQRIEYERRHPNGPAEKELQKAVNKAEDNNMDVDAMLRRSDEEQINVERRQLAREKMRG